jgi:hypothetical protein
MKFAVCKMKKLVKEGIGTLTIWRRVRIEKRMYFSFSTYILGPGQEEGEARGEGERERERERAKPRALARSL